MIAAHGQDAGRIAGAVTEGIGALDRESRDALGIVGFQPFTDRDYEVIAQGARLLG
jgi:hypothetical protein